MKYLLLATDYDGTIASQGKVDITTVTALGRVLASGRKLVLVTGRHLPELKTVFPRLELFARVVVENGALLYRPDTYEEKRLSEAPPQRFLEVLRERQVPMQVGSGIVATWDQHQEVVLRTIRELGLELRVILNKGAVMVLPSGVDKATGLKAALDDLGVSPENVVGFGDGENDHAFLEICGLSVAVGNALPELKKRADIVTKGTHGAGVAEVIEQLLHDDLASYQDRASSKRG
jgi:hydroxymethylpyrimidine pyrophosphatase-like HAD family hydrolase